MLIVHRTTLRRRRAVAASYPNLRLKRSFHSSLPRREEVQRQTDANSDPRLSDTGKIIEDKFARIREDYATPKNPIVLAHGLFGFDELRPAAGLFPAIQYWSGVEDALRAKGIEVYTATVPPSGRVEVRAKRLAEDIEHKAKGRAVNIIAGLDARHMISRMSPPNVSVLSLTTIATPHRGSAFASFLFSQLGTSNLTRLFKIMDYFGFESGAFRQLTQEYMTEKFNPRTPDVEGVRYYSYGAALHPHFTSVFRQSHSIVQAAEGENDGLVSVESSRWGTYKGTLQDVSHLDLINWTNKLRWYLLMSLTGKRRNFNAIAFYLGIADMLAKEGL